MKLPTLILACVSLGGPLLAADTYTLIFDRTTQAGQRFTFDAKVSFEEKNDMTVNGRPVRNEQKSGTCKLAGEMEIVAVHATGAPREVLLKLTQAEGSENGQPAEPFKAGDKIRATRGETRTSFEVQDQAPTVLQGKLLDSLSLVSSAAPQKDDKIFGPGRPVSAGEQWPVRGEAAAADSELKALGQFKAEDIQGTVRCIGPVTHGGTPCVKARAEMKMSTSGGGLPGAPPQIKVRSMTIGLSGEADLPLGPNGPRPLDTMEMTMRVEAGGTLEQNGVAQAIEVQANHRRTKEVRLTPVK